MKFLLIVIFHKEILEHIFIVWCFEMSIRIDDGENFDLKNLCAGKKKKVSC